MIKNDKQLSITQSKLGYFKDILTDIQKKKVPSKRDSILKDIQISSITSQIATLEAEIKEYLSSKEKSIHTLIPTPLRNIIFSQLKDAGMFCTIGAFNDGSGSWITVYKEDPKKVVAPKTIQVMSISFNHEGTVLTNIRVFDENHSVTVEGGKMLF